MYWYSIDHIYTIQMKISNLITFTFWTFLLIIGILVLNYYVKQEQFQGTMVTNIQHHPNHKKQSHDSREHPDSHQVHTHSIEAKLLDEIRFNA